MKILACQGCHSVKCGDGGPKTCGHSLDAISEAVRRIGNTAASFRRDGPPSRSTYVLRRVNRKAFGFR